MLGLGVVGSNLIIFKLELTRPNILQHVTTGWPNSPNNVAICCIEMFSFGQGLRNLETSKQVCLQFTLYYIFVEW